MKRLAILLVFLTTLGAGAEPFSEGLEAYQAQAYARAAESFRIQVGETPRDAAAHFNLGLCYFHLEDWGRARASWETAWVLAPHWSAPGNALSQLNDQIRDGRREMAGRRNSAHWLSLGQWVALAALGWWLAMAGVILRYRKPSNAAQGMLWVGVVLLVAGCLGSLTRYLEPPRAVVVASKVFLKNGPGNEFTDSLSLYSGHLVKVRDREGSWVEVVVRGQVQGWLRSGQLKEIPNY